MRCNTSGSFLGFWTYTLLNGALFHCPGIQMSLARDASAFADYYRCPGEFGEFEIASELSPDEGYFSFRDAICFGRRHGGPPAKCVAGNLDDVSRDAECQGGRVRLPFDLSEVADNLRQERYYRHSHPSGEAVTAARAARSAYYLLRPIMPVAVRKHLQKLRLRGWEEIPFPHWPVDFTVETLMQRAMALDLK